MTPYRFITGVLFPVLAAVGCGNSTSNATPLHHGALFRSEWQPVYRNPSKSAVSFDDEFEGAGDVIAAEALKLYRQRQSASHFGAADVTAIFQRAGFPGCWKASDDVPDFVKKADRNGAYFTRSKPRKGDLILFHNQFDRNRNGRSDDWFTGVAVVVDAGRRTHAAVTRTGGVPRMIKISPEGPMVRQYKGRDINSYVKIPAPHDPVDAQYLSGQLYAGYIDTAKMVAHCPKSN